MIPLIIHPVVRLREALVLLAVAALVLTMSLPYASAEDGAHGGDNAASDSGDTAPAGQAVNAPRTTENFTEPGGMTQNPIAIDFDPRGNLYVVEAWRAGVSVIDNRNAGLRRSNGVINDLRKTSVEDRLEQIEMLEEEGYYPEGTFTKAADKVRVLKDTDGDGKADESFIFADNFNDKLDGIAAGVLWHNGKVYLTNIPHLWLLEDKDGDGDADKQTPGERTSLSYGYGIRWAFYGHDMHGLIKGPDGRIYFSIGDRGYNVKTKEGKQLYGPDQGAVFRMWPDGSELEVFHEGLRNPQELAFDNFGNLFTGDNNSDSGDQARFVHVVEGGHSGWNQDVQSLNDRGPWNREHMWEPRFGKDDVRQPAWIIPPIANVGRGPSGLAHYPGTGDVFPANGSFLLCDFPVGIRHVHVRPSGAGFELVEDSRMQTVGERLTDVAWGYDGRLYVADWGVGWGPNDKGYMKTMVNEPAHEAQAEVLAQVESLFAGGFDTLSDDKLIELLGHRDQRVRLNAQWEIASRNGSEKRLFEVLRDKEAAELQRLHALWAIAMRAHQSGDQKQNVGWYVETALTDQSPVIRANAAKALGDLDYPDAHDLIAELLEDHHAPVRYEAAIALGKVQSKTYLSALLDLLQRNGNEDAYIRHAASYGLSLMGDASLIHEQAKERGPAARLGAVLALRKLESPLLAEYLRDDDLLVAAEAVRAIYDMKVMDAFPALAALADTLPKNRYIEPIARRVIEANVRLADTDSASRLARLAARSYAPELWRRLALRELDNWSNERNREGVWGHWWPRPEQSMDPARSALIAELPAILRSTEGELNELARTIEQKHVANVPPDELARIALSADEPAELRRVVARKLVEKDASRAAEVAAQVIADTASPASLRIAMRELLVELDSAAGVAAYLAAYQSGTTPEQQDAIHALAAHSDHAEAQEQIRQIAKDLSNDALPAELRLDAYQAITRHDTLPDAVRRAAATYRQQNLIPGEEPFIRDASLAGGSVRAGREVFFNHPGASCTQCHRLDNKPAQGPNLSGIGAVKDLDYLYTAVVRPSADIAEGYANTVVNLKSGKLVSGRVIESESTPQQLVLIDANGEELIIPRDTIDGQPITSDQSSMKQMNDQLSPTELRDLLAYLASLQDTSNSRYVAASVGASAGPLVDSPARGMVHAVWLPIILIGIAGGLGLILIATLLGGSFAAASGQD